MSDPKKKRPMTASDYIKNLPSLQGKPLTIQNSYSALAEFPPLSYSKAVASEKGQPSTQPTSQPSSQKPEYITKTQKQHLITTNFTKPTTLNQLQNFVNRYLYQDCQYPTDNVIKNRTFYEYILVDSKSVEIKHYEDKSDPTITNYSTCKILKVCSIQDLGFIHHHTMKSFSTPGYHIPGYTYVDYQNAFFRLFYLKPRDHSWFISFDHKCPKTIPGWFYEWWHWFGPIDQIYPKEIKTSLPFYTKYAPKTPILPLTKIYFHIDMGIPWICSWHYNLIPHLPDMPYSLVREFRIKWWDKYDLNRCSLANIQKFFQITKEVETTVRAVSKAIPLVTPDQFTQQSIPKNSPNTKRPQSPANSTGSSNSKKSAKKNKLKEILAALSQHMETSDDDDDEVMQVKDSDSSDPHPDDIFGGPLGQDPFEI